MAGSGFSILLIILSVICILGVTFSLTRMVEDFVKGLYLIILKPVRIGDLVIINNIEGTLEKISLQMVTIKDSEGNYHYIRNSIVKKIENKSKNYVFCPIRVVVPKEINISDVIKSIKTAINQVITETNFSNSIYDELEIYSIDKTDNKNFCIEGKIKTSPYAKELVRCEIEKRVMKSFIKTTSMQTN